MRIYHIAVKERTSTKLKLKTIIGSMLQRLLWILVFSVLVIAVVGAGIKFFASSRNLGHPDLLLTLEGELGYVLYKYVFSQ